MIGARGLLVFLKFSKRPHLPKECPKATTSDRSVVHCWDQRSCGQGRLFFYYSPQMLGNNFFHFGEEFQALGKKEKVNKLMIMKKIK